MFLAAGCLLWLAAGLNLAVTHDKEIYGEIKPVGDIDKYSLHRKAGDALLIVGTERGNSCRFDLQVDVYKPFALGKSIAQGSADQCKATATVDVTLTDDGVYTIVVREASGGSVPYTLEIVDVAGGSGPWWRFW